MGNKRIIKLPTVDGIKASSAAGAVGIWDLPIGYTYYKVQIVYIDGGSSPTDINSLFDDILILKNSVAERTHSAAELERLNAINGSQYGRQQVNTGANMRQSLNIFFFEPWRKDKVDSASGAWIVTPQAGFRNFQISAKLLAAVPSTGSFEAYAWVDDALALPANTQQLIKKVYREQITASGLVRDVKQFASRDLYQTILLKHPDSAGVITKATLQLGSQQQIVEVYREDMVAHLTGLGLNPANSTSAGAFGYEIVLDADDPKESNMNANGLDVWLKLFFSTAASGNAFALIERVGIAD